MKMFFCGTTDFGRTILHALIQSNHQILGVVSQPDKTRGKNRFHPVKISALEKGLPLFQPENINQSDFLAQLEEQKPQIIVVAAYGQIVHKRFLGIAPLGCYNVHGSLLPNYRGASPIHHALLHGETITGITIQKMVRKLDAGPILLQKELAILPGENSSDLSKRLSVLGAEGLVEALEKIESDQVELRPQDDSQATYGPTLKRDDGRISWEKSPEELVNFIRAMTHWPGAWCLWERPGKDPLRLTISNSRPTEGKGSEGEVIRADKKGLVVATGQGAIEILELTPAFKKKLKARDFINGYRIKHGDEFV